MQNGARRHVTSEAVFNGCGYAWEAVYRPSDSSLSGVPLGAPLTDLNCPRFSLNINGRLLRGSGGPEVYVMQGGLKRHIPNSPTFNGRGYSFGNVDAVHATYIGAIITGAPVLDILSDGHLLKGPGPEVYVMQNGTRRHIVSEAVFAACGYSWAAIHGVASYDLPLIPQGAPLAGMPCLALSLPDGALIRGSSGTVYATEAGKKRQIQDASVFGSCSYHWGNVDQIRDAVLNAVVPGPVLTNPPCP
jgi:hypothetical protein